MYSRSFSGVPAAIAVLAIFGNLTAVGCAQQRPAEQTDAVTPPDVDLSPPADGAAADVPAAADVAPALNSAALSPVPNSAAPPAGIAELEEAANGDVDNGAVRLPEQPTSGTGPITDVERASPPPVPEVSIDEESIQITDESVAGQPDEFHPPQLTVQQRLDLLEKQMAYHREAILEINAAPEVDERLQKIESDLVDLRKSFNNVAKLITADQRPSLQPETSQERTSEKQTSQQLGLLVIENQTGLAYPMTVNGYRFQIVPGRHQFKVPVGEVTTELNGFEDAKRWQAGDWREVNGQQQLAIQIQ